MDNGERHWRELCTQAAATTDPEERGRIVRELADLLSDMQRYIKDHKAEEQKRGVSSRTHRPRADRIGPE